MHVAVDAYLITEREKAGIPLHLLNLLRAIIRVDAENTYTAYVRKLPTDLAPDNSRCRIEKLPFCPDQFPPFWHHAPLAVKMLSTRPDIFFSHTVFSSYYCPAKFILLAHDITPFLFPRYFRQTTINRISLKTYQKLALPHAVKRADAIIADSHSTKSDLVNFLKADPDKIFVTYAGYDVDVYKRTNSVDEIEASKRRYGIDTNYILYVGRLEPNKNVLRLVEAFALLRKDRRIDHKLVITGKKGWLYNDLFRKVVKLDLDKEVVFTGYVPQSDLSVLMSGADVFVYPSLYEGFGFPPLEAMACGTPVITSNLSSLPEVVGDAGILVDPCSIDEIARAIHEVVEDGELRQKMREKGLERAKMFSWEKTARETIEIFAEVCRWK